MSPQVGAWWTFLRAVSVLNLARWRADIAEWRTEIPWMSLYFSVAVWISVGLTRSPRLAAELER